MYRALVGLLLGFTLRAQMPQRDAMEEASSAYFKARSEGRFDVASAKREEMRQILDGSPATSPQLPNWVQRVSQAYQESAMSVQGRAVVEQALARTSGLGESAPARIQMLNMLANYWEQDRNLLKAASYLEKVAEAAANAPQAPALADAQARALRGVITSGPIS